MYYLRNLIQIRPFVKRSLQFPEIVPLVSVVGVALAGGGFTIFHQAESPDVVWNHKTHSQPWQDVGPGDQVKLAAFNQHYNRRFERKEW